MLQQNLTGTPEAEQAAQAADQLSGQP